MKILFIGNFHEFNEGDVVEMSAGKAAFHIREGRALVYLEPEPEIVAVPKQATAKPVAVRPAAKRAKPKQK